MKLMSVEQLMQREILWLEGLQAKRRAHIDELLALVSAKQLEIDNLWARLGKTPWTCWECKTYNGHVSQDAVCASCGNERQK